MVRLLSFYVLISVFISIRSFSHENKGSNRSPFVKVKQGTLEGAVSVSRSGKNKYYSFWGIPFAEPPIGDLRFELRFQVGLTTIQVLTTYRTAENEFEKMLYSSFTDARNKQNKQLMLVAPPIESGPWQGVRNATTPPPICIQSEVLNVSLAGQTVIYGQEDCLYLNVFTPYVKFQSLLPVLVFFHGGVYSSGGAIFYGPDYLMDRIDRPMIFVTIAYRLGLFGFLSAVDDVLPGNYGFKDQRAGLRWVQENIAAFGGDPNRVTISGQSAGAGSVHFFLFSYSSTGLFHQAISQSGTAFTPALITTRTARDRARALGVLTGCPNLETKALVQCLRRVPADQLIKAQVKFFVFDTNPLVTFGPVVEPKCVQDAFLTVHPWSHNIVNSVPYIIGIVADEGTMLAPRILSIPADLTEWSLHYDRMFPLIFSYFDTTDLRTSLSLTTSIKQFYFGNEEISLRTNVNFRQMFADGYFTTTSLETAIRQPNKVYFYLYDHLNAYSLEEEYGNITFKHGAAHGDDLLSLYNSRGLFPPVTQGPDLLVSERMVSYWVNFVTKGDPNEGKEIWRPFSAQNFNYLHILTERDVMQQHLLVDRYIFWRRIFPFRWKSSRKLIRERRPVDLRKRSTKDIFKVECKIFG